MVSGLREADHRDGYDDTDVKCRRVSRPGTRIAFSSYPTAMDPQFHNLGANLNIALNMFDTLVRMDADGRRIPGLADSWTMVDDNTGNSICGLSDFPQRREIDRPGCYLLACAAGDAAQQPSRFGIYTKSITGSIAIGDSTFRLTTNGPYPLMLSDLSTIFILRKPPPKH